MIMNILVFAPHPDDEVLGVGGTIAKFSQQGHNVFVCIVTTTNDPKLKATIRSEAKEAHKLLGVKNTVYLDLPVVELNDLSKKMINSKIGEIVKSIKPEIVFLPHIGDMHTDHFEVTDSAMVSLRPFESPQLKLILAYETLSETEWNIPSTSNAFIPNTWIDVSSTIGIKFKAMQAYNSQLLEFPHPRSLKAIEALSQLRGSTIATYNAESFYVIRQIYNISDNLKF